jgi:hypothetical protein
MGPRTRLVLLDVCICIHVLVFLVHCTPILLPRSTAYCVNRRSLARVWCDVWRLERSVDVIPDRSQSQTIFNPRVRPVGAHLLRSNPIEYPHPAAAQPRGRRSRWVRDKREASSLLEEPIVLMILYALLHSAGTLVRSSTSTSTFHPSPPFEALSHW